MKKFIEVTETESIINYKNNKHQDLERKIIININHIVFFTNYIIITTKNNFGITVKETKEEILKKIKGE